MHLKIIFKLLFYTMVRPISQHPAVSLSGSNEPDFVLGGTFSVAYGLRSSSPELGRWVNRDPIGEKGGVNIFGFVVNKVLNSIDHLGLWPGFRDCSFLRFDWDTGWLPIGYGPDDSLTGGASSSGAISDGAIFYYQRHTLEVYLCSCCDDETGEESYWNFERGYHVSEDRTGSFILWNSSLPGTWPPFPNPYDLIQAFISGLINPPTPLGDTTWLTSRLSANKPSSSEMGEILSGGTPHIWCWW